MSKISLLPPLPLPFLPTDIIPVTRAGITYQAPTSALKSFTNTDPTVVPSSNPFKGALVRKTTNSTGLTFPVIVAWEEELYDTNNFWNSGAPTRLTIISGVTKIRITGSLAFEPLAAVGSVFAQILKNGTAQSPGSGFTFRQDAAGFSDNVVPIMTPIIDVVAGDYFELTTQVSMSGQDQITFGYRTWLNLEVVEHTL
jgi:hypothetical protein